MLTSRMVSRVSFLCFAFITGLVASSHSAFAGPIRVGFEIETDLSNGVEGVIKWDVELKDGTVKRGTSTTTGTAANDRNQTATDLAASINASLGAESATATDEFVSLSASSFRKTSILTGTNITVDPFVEYDSFGQASGSLNFDPDPDTGLAVLLEDGEFGVTGPGGLSAFFSAPTGTTSSELASLFFTAMSIPGYDIDLVATSVFFETLGPGVISLRATADGLEYSIRTVPEPSTLSLFGISVLALLCYAWKRRRQLTLGKE